MTTEILAYLDHNILDTMTKGDPWGIKELMCKLNLTPVYSQETLREIKRSVGFEDSFLAVLNDIGAKYIVPIFENNAYTGNANIHDSNVFEIYSHFSENDRPMPELGYGLTGMLQKFYGGRKDQSFEEIFLGGADELKTLVNEAMTDFDGIDTLDDTTKDQIREFISDLPELIKQQYQLISTDMDKQLTPPVKQFEKVTQLGAKVLKNIKPPKVLEQIFDLLQKTIPVVDLDIDIFFGVKSQPFESNPDREKTPLEKVNGIYHQLNFLGYYRDSDMKKERGFIRHSSDMTHAGIATFCQFIFCSDEDFVKKAEAAYEYVGVNTKIVYLQAKKQIQPTANTSDD